MGFSGTHGVVPLFIIFIVIIGISQAIYPPGCSTTQYVPYGSYSYIYNPGYAQNYTPYTDCLWYRYSPAGTIFYINCQDVVIPPTSGCSGDQLLVSMTGDTTFTDASVYCGVGQLSLRTTNNIVAIGLRASSTSRGGRLYCTLTVEIPPPTCDCGLKSGTRIVGGTLSGINEYPMVAGIIDSSSVAEVICGATIISDRYVLTAAHCMNLIAKAYMGILVGDWNYTTGSDTSAAALYTVDAIIVHELFNEQAQTNDIALVRTTKQIVFSLYVSPACLPFRYTTADFTNQNVTYLGWGQLFFNGPISDTLYKVTVPVISNTACQQAYNNVQISGGHICTYTKGKDACQGDSGGPVLWMDPLTNRLQLIGVTSFGYACGIKPGIDTRVTNYLQWIVNKATGATFCQR